MSQHKEYVAEVIEPFGLVLAKPIARAVIPRITWSFYAYNLAAEFAKPSNVPRSRQRLTDVSPLGMVVCLGQPTYSGVLHKSDDLLTHEVNDQTVGDDDAVLVDADEAQLPPGQSPDSFMAVAYSRIFWKGK